MKVFSGKKAAEDYMSSHTLAFSTPELTLTRYSFWLGDMVPDPAGGGAVPRLYTYVEEKDFEPVSIVDEEKYVPTGAVRRTGAYGGTAPEPSGEAKFCHECGAKASAAARFCPGCGATQG